MVACAVFRGGRVSLIMQRALTLLAALVAGLAAWTSLGALAVLPRDPSQGLAVVRVGVLPTIGVALMFAALFLVGFARWPQARAAVVLPALLLLPWLPIDRLPATLLWAGPIVAVVWAAWAIATAMIVGLRAPRGLTPWFVEPRRAALVASVIAAAAYVTGLALVANIVPAGDEPHYLIIARSLVADGDLRIDNNHESHDYLPWFEGELKPDYLRRGVDGAIYSIHAPGLPVLIAPALALFGYRGAMVFLALVSAFGMGLVWRLAFEVTGRAGAAWAGWASVAFAAPLFLHAFTVYPDAPAGILVVAGLLAFVRLSTSVSRAQLVIAGAALAALPWFHTRYALLAGALGAAIAGRLVWRRYWREAGVFLAVPTLSAIGWFWFFQTIYGTPNPTAPYGGYTQASASFVPTGLTGLLMDQQFGLLTTAPVLAFALAGLGLMLGMRPATPACEPGGQSASRQDFRGLALVLLAVCVPYALAASAYRMWWGGLSGPARFLAPLVPALAVPIAVLWARARAGATRALALWALIWSIGLTWILIVQGGERLGFAFTTRTPIAAWTAWLATAVDLSSALPALFRGSLSTAIGQTGVWAAALALTWLLLRRLERGWGMSVLLTAVWTPLSLGVGAMAALTVSWTIADAPPLRPLVSQAALAMRTTTMMPGPRSGVAFTPVAGPLLAMRTTRPRDVLPLLRLASELPRNRPDAEGLFHLPPLPAGDYRLRVAPESGAPEFQLLVSPVTTKSAALAQVSAGGRLRLPVPVEGLVVQSASPFRAGEVSLEPLSLAANAWADDRRATRAAVYGGVQVFFTGYDTFPEPNGFWVRAGRDASVAMARPGAAARLALFLRNAPTANRVSLASGSWRESFDLRPGEERTVDLPEMGMAGAARVVRIHPERGVRPSEVQPGNRDFRRLGVWVEVRPR